MKVGRHVFSCRSLLLSTTVLNDNWLSSHSYRTAEVYNITIRVYQSIHIIALLEYF